MPSLYWKLPLLQSPIGGHHTFTQGRKARKHVINHRNTSSSRTKKTPFKCKQAALALQRHCLTLKEVLQSAAQHGFTHPLREKMKKQTQRRTFIKRLVPLQWHRDILLRALSDYTNKIIIFLIVDSTNWYCSKREDFLTERDPSRSFQMVFHTRGYFPGRTDNSEKEQTMSILTLKGSCLTAWKIKQSSVRGKMVWKISDDAKQKLA